MLYDSSKNPYKILGVSPADSKEKVKKEYKRLMKELHPDKGGTDVNRFQDVKEAWDFLDSMGDDAFSKSPRVHVKHESLFYFSYVGVFD